MKTKQFILVLLALFASVTAKGFRIDVGDDEDHLWLTLTVLNEDQKTAEVTSTDYAWGTCTIPAAANGYTIVSIGDNAFKNQTDLVEVVIPNTVTSIGASAFEGCTALGTLDHPVVVPASVTSVGVDAFKGTWWLDNTLPNGVVYINNTLYIYKGEMPANTAINIADGTTTILSGAFKDCTGLTSVTIPATVTAIGSQAFDGCSSLTSVIVKNPTPVGISSNTFSNAANATLFVNGYDAYNAYRVATNWKDFMKIVGNIEFADESVKNYCVKYWDTNNDGELSFEEAASVTSIRGKFNNLTFSSFDEFKYFTGITEINGDVRSGSFTNCTIGSLTIPSNVKTFAGGGGSGEMPFAGTTLTRLIICDGDDDLTISIGGNNSVSGLFQNSKLSSLYLGRNYTLSRNYIGEPFSTSTLEDLTIGEKVTIIRGGAFGSCKLVSVTIPSSVTSIGGNAFNYKLEEIVFENGDADLSLDRPLFPSLNTIYLGRPISSSSTFSFSSLANLNTLYVTNTYLSDALFANCSALETVFFNENLETISPNAFKNCISINHVEFPNSLKTIGANAFEGCTSINTLDIPEGVTSIGEYAFSGCNNLSSVQIGEGLQSIGSYTFKDCSLLSSITVPSTVNSIGDNPMPSNRYIHFRSTVPVPAFQISLPCILFVPDNAVADYKTAWPDYSMYIVGEGDFTEKAYNITAQESTSALLEAIGEENTLKVVKLKVSGTINSYDMMVMRNKMPNLRELDLSEVSIVANNYDYGTGVSQNNVFPDFLKTTVLTSLVLPNTITSIGNYAFNSTTLQLETLTIPASVQSIGDYAFQKSKIDVRFVENSQLNSIGQYAFNKSSLVNLQLDNVTIASNAFSECSSLKTIEVNGGSIGNSAFSGCNNLETIVVNSTLPYSYSYISYGAFYDCVSLKNVTIGANYIPKYAFSHCPIENLVVTRGVIREYAFADVDGYVGVKSSGSSYYYSALKSVIIQEGITKIEKGAFKAIILSKVNATLSLPESLTSIGDEAFSGWSGLKGELVIPRGVTVIPSKAFASCGASSVKLSPNTTKICSNAFSNCTNLGEIRLPSTLTTLEDNAFSGCSNLKTVYAYMPDVITIGTNTFPDYQMSKLYVPSFLYYTYYWDSNWSQFLQVLRCDLQPGDYETFYTNGDILFAEGEERITTDTPIATIGSQGSITVEGEAQAFDTVDQTVDADYSASLIGDGEGQANNMPMNELHVNIAVTAGKWYFFCFPFDVTITSCTYPGRYAWRSYDGATRAANGSGGWKKVTAEKLNAREGYAFQSETTGTLTVRFSAPTFGGNRTRELEVHSASNAQNASWNFVGNPYSSYYDFGTADITSPITVWTGSSYTAYRPGDDELHLRPYQAFFVQKPEAASSIQFNASRRESYRQSQHTAASRALAPRTENVKSDRIFLDIAISDNDTATLDRTRLVLNEKAQRSYELDCDAAKFMADDAAAQIYMMEDGQPMAINERPVKGDIRLGYKAKNKGTLSIKAQRMDLPMLLVDLVTGTEYDLSNGVYEFSTEAGTFNKRFMLRLSGEATAIRNLANETGVTISKTKGGLNVAGAEGKTVEVYNVGGSLVSCQNNGFISLPTGIYLVKVNDKSTKISVK